MKRGEVLLIVILVIIGLEVVSAGNCAPENTIMNLFSPSNSHGALWNFEDYNYDICYSNIFGSAYAIDLGNVHDCTGTNKVLGLHQHNNSHAQIPSLDNYPFDVCYGDLVCEERDISCDYSQKEEMVAALYQDSNSHITDPNYMPEGMISWWSLDKGTEVEGKDVSYDVLNRNDLTLHNMDNENLVIGKVGRALTFDGDKEYGEVENDASLNPTEQITLEAWVKPDNNKDIGAIIKKIDGGVNGYVLEGSKHVTGEQTFRFAIYNGTCQKNDALGIPQGWCYTDSTPSLTNKQWYHLIGTYDGSKLRLYLNSELISEASVSGSIITSTNSLMIGKDPSDNSADKFFKGTIDEIAIYNRALTQEEIQHRYNMGIYEIKICCKSGVSGTGEVYWANMLGQRINKAELNDTVLMVYEGASKEYSFSIYEEGAGESIKDEIRVGNDAIPTFKLENGKAIAKWKITDNDFILGIQDDSDGTEEFHFEVNGKKSGDLIVSAVPNNAKPHAIITYPSLSLTMENRRFRLGKEIVFNQVSWDEDDDLVVIWDFGDENTKVCEADENCNTTHDYDMWGTKDIKLEAIEVDREVPQKAENYTQIFIYNNSINVFALITEPPFYPPKIFQPNKLVNFNANESWVSNCSTISTACGPHGEKCYAVDDLYCYDFNKSGAFGIGNSPGQYDLWFSWMFSDNTELYGNWLGEYDEVVNFQKYFYEPTKHWANLKVGYDQK